MATDDPRQDSERNDAGKAGADAGAAKAKAAGRASRRVPPTLDLSARDVTSEAASSPVPVDSAAAKKKPASAEPPAAPEMPADHVASDAVTPKASASDTAAPKPGETVPQAESTDETGGDTQPASSESTSEPEPAAPPAPPAGRRLGVFGGLVLALISGIIGGAFALGVVTTFYDGSENVDAITELEARALDLRQRVESLETRDPDASVAAGIAVPDELAARLDALESGVSTLGRKVEALPAATTAGDGAGTSAASAASEQSLTELEGRVGALEERVTSQSEKAQVPEEALAASQARVDALEQRVAALPAPAPAATPQDLAAVDARVATIEQRLAQATRQQGDGRIAAQLVALSSLRSAVQDGKPYQAELNAVRSLLGSEGDSLSALDTFASTGLPSGAALAARLRSAVAAGNKAATEGASSTAPASSSTEEGVVAWLKHSAQELVSVSRRADQDAAAPALAEVEAALLRGDYPAAQAALAYVPEADRMLAQPVLEASKAREDALAAITTLNQRLLTSLAGGAQ